MKATVQFFLILALSGSAWAFGATYGGPDLVTSRVRLLTDRGLSKTQELREAAEVQIIATSEKLLHQFDQDNVYDGFQEVELVPQPAALATPAAGQEARPNTNIPDLSAVPNPEEIIVAVPARVRPAPNVTVFDDTMQVCLTSVSNAPDQDQDGNITGFRPTADIDGSLILISPTTQTCLSSGFGPRGNNGRFHKGVDYYTQKDGKVLAGGDGTILEALYRDDYGYMIVIDHGNGVYTRYAHLKRFEPGIEPGAHVTQGQRLGPIGSSGAYTSAAHLHYEVLRGDYANPRASFGLTPVDPYTFL